MKHATESLAQDLKYAFRGLRKSRGISSVAIATLAFSIGANTAVFSIVNTVLLKALPYPGSDRLVVLDEYRLEHGSRTVSWQDFNDWKAQNTAFEDLAAFRVSHLSMTGSEQPALLRAAEVSYSFFSLLGARPESGRLFDLSDDGRNGRRVVIASHEFCVSHFGNAPTTERNNLTLDGVSYSVIGVLQPSFSFFDNRIDIYLPVGLHDADSEWAARSTHPDLLVLAKLRPGVSIGSARSSMNLVMQRLEHQYPQSNVGLIATVSSLYQFRYGSIRTVLLTLFAAVGCVLIIGCANVGNLLLARGASRRKELAVRAALGAGHFHIVRQLIAESIVLSFLGGVVGIFLAFGAVHFVAVFGPRDVPHIAASRIDGSVLMFTFAVSALTALLLTAIPAFVTLSSNVSSALNESGRSGGTGRIAARVRSILVVGEISIALVLVTASALLIGSLKNALDSYPGFVADHLLTMDVFIAPNKYADAADKRQFFSQAVDRLQHLPGVRHAGAALCPPLVGVCSDSAFMLADHPIKSVVDLPTAASNIVTPGYFESMGISTIEGRPFVDGDNEHSRLVVVVNRSFAHRYWPGQSAIGRRLREGGPTGGQPYREIVGVVADVKQLGLDIGSRPEVFLPSTQFPFAPWTPLQAMTFVIDTNSAPELMEGSAKRALNGLDKDLPVTAIHPISDSIAESLARRRFLTSLFGAFAALSLLLSAIGTYGVIAYDVNQKKHEMSIRMALGASPARIRNLVIAQALLLAICGVVVGSLGAFASAHWMSSMLFGIGHAEPAIFGGSAGILVVVSVASGYIPMRRAAAADPAAVLRLD